MRSLVFTLFIFLIWGCNTQQSTQVGPHYHPGIQRTSTYRSLVLSSSPVSYWRLDESAGTTAVDTQGVNNGTYNGGFTLGQTGGIQYDTDTAVTFNGASGYMGVNSSASLQGMATLTFEIWIYMYNLPTVYFLFGKDTVGAEYRILINPDGSGQFVINTVNNNWYTAGTIANWSSGAVHPGQWYHIVGTYDGTWVRAYINGSFVGIGTQAISGAIKSNGDNLEFGFQQYGGDWFHGVLDDIAIYNTALSASQIQAHYQEGAYGN